MHAFDPKNGQIFTESSSSCNRSMIPMWKRHVTGRPVDPRTYKNSMNGASKLQDMALRSCCWNIDMFGNEALRGAGWFYAEMIYQGLKKIDALSFAAWTLFHAVFPEQPALSHCFSVARTHTRDSWLSIVENLGKLDRKLSTRLCAPGLTLTLNHLLSLLQIPSLAALVHVCPEQTRSHPLSTSELRTWCRAVREKNACRKLKVLVLSAVTDDEPGDFVALQHLSSFPALELVGFARPGVGRAVRSEKEKRKKDEDAQWERPDPTLEQKFSEIICGSGKHADCSIAQRTSKLCASVGAVGEAETNDAEVELSLTCYGDRSATLVGNVTWFIRRRVEPEKAAKQSLDAKISGNGGEHGVKKRKIRHEKRQDVGSLLGTFG